MHTCNATTITTDNNNKHLRDERDEVAKLGALLRGLEQEDGQARLVVAPLQLELIGVALRVALDVALREVGGKRQEASWSARQSRRQAAGGGSRLRRQAAAAGGGPQLACRRACSIVRACRVCQRAQRAAAERSRHMRTCRSSLSVPEIDMAGF